MNWLCHPGLLHAVPTQPRAGARILPGAMLPARAQSVSPLSPCGLAHALLTAETDYLTPIATNTFRRVFAEGSRVNGTTSNPTSIIVINV